MSTYESKADSTRTSQFGRVTSAFDPYRTSETSLSAGRRRWSFHTTKYEWLTSDPRPCAPRQRSMTTLAVMPETPVPLNSELETLAHLLHTFPDQIVSARRAASTRWRKALEISSKFAQPENRNCEMDQYLRWWRWTQSTANSSPLSTFLITGKNTGNFAKSGIPPQF